MDKIEEIASLIKNSKNIVVLVGAGLSTASNIGDIRSKEAKIRSILLKKKYFEFPVFTKKLRII